jgi:hypothetical protein
MQRIKIKNRLFLLGLFTGLRKVSARDNRNIAPRQNDVCFPVIPYFCQLLFIAVYFGQVDLQSTSCTLSGQEGKTHDRLMPRYASRTLSGNTGPLT